jgi:Sulfotransferase domain
MTSTTRTAPSGQAAPDRSRLKRSLRGGTKRTLRAWGELTASLRCLPDFMIIGAKRGGTTSLYKYLLQHPKVAPLFPARQNIKGTHFFDSEFHRGVRWYRSHFPTGASSTLRSRGGVPALAGEGSPYYLFHPLAAERAAEVAPDAKLIGLLRDPVERTYSQYKERLRHGSEELSFEQALDAESARLAGEEERLRREPTYYSYAHEHQSYIAQGRYLDMLPRWLDRYPSERVLILPSEDLYADPQATVDRVFAFLGLPPFMLPDVTRHNYVPARGMRQQTRRHLQCLFAEHNRELARYLGMPLPWA